MRTTDRRTRRLAALLVCAGLALTGCTAEAAAPAAEAAAVEGAAPAAPVVIDVQPASASVDVSPSAPVVVTANDGRLTSVTLTDAKDRQVEGQLSPDGTTWRAQGLRIAQHYRLQVRAVDAAGAATERMAVFATVRPRKELETAISPLDGQTVGVGMPVVVRFNADVRDKAAVESALSVTTSKPVVGSWSWTADDEVHYRPQEFWPPGTEVEVGVDLKGVDAGRGVWGLTSRTIGFRTGSSMVSVVDVARHRMTVYRNGKQVRVVPVSTGKAGFLTRNGTKVILEKHELKVMDATTIGIGQGDPEYYRLDVPYAMRVTWSGEFVHAAPWSVGSQGRANVSHGCVGMSPADAIWLFNRSTVGDVVEVVNSPRELEPGNGYTDWNVDWDAWVAGSALPV